MFRVTAILKPGHDMAEVTFLLRAPSVAVALTDAMVAMSQLGFKAEDYSLTHSVNLQ